MHWPNWSCCICYYEDRFQNCFLLIVAGSFGILFSRKNTPPPLIKSFFYVLNICTILSISAGVNILLNVLINSYQSFIDTKKKNPYSFLKLCGIFIDLKRKNAYSFLIKSSEAYLFLPNSC